MKPAAFLPEGSPEAQVRAYHQRTKHAFGRYAASPGYLDWDSQPNPFRRFRGAEVTTLPLTAERRTVLYADLSVTGKIPPAVLNREGVGVLLELSFGLAAWKQHGGERWALRCNPSSGNLHPTEAYIIAAAVDGLQDGVHHYVSHDHALEHRCQCAMPFRGLLVGLTSIHWREAWKYGERAFRYCQHDIGHALGALRYAAAVLGWRVRLLDEWGDDAIGALLGVDRSGEFAEAEPEVPDMLCLIETGPRSNPAPGIDTLVSAARAGLWRGQANTLSQHHEFDWPLIEDIHRATRKPNTPGQHPVNVQVLPTMTPSVCEIGAVALIKRRRSAQAFDGRTAIPAKTLYRILDATLPRPGMPPFDAWNWSPRVHLVLFIHRVQGLSPGLYVFCRDPAAEPALRTRMNPAFAWAPAAGCPEHLFLFQLVRADARHAAKTLSCQQDIAGDSAFSLGMLAEFDAGIAEGPWVYRRLFWECGLIGQTLYLEAEAAGVRGTGIGCFFDDPVHELLGLHDAAFQSLYHFTIGGPLVDARLQTLPGYAHLGQAEEP